MMNVPADYKAVAVLSGGLDSTALVYDAIDSGIDVVAAVSFNYGQRHKKEILYARDTCAKLGIPHIVIDLWASGLTDALSDSASSLISETEVPEGHYAEDNMKATVVPNRNMIMLSIAGGIAVAKKAQFVLTGVHAGDHFIYPDCRPEFIEAASTALRVGNAGFGDLAAMPIYAPYMYMTKADIATRAIALNIPLDETWSCYKGGDNHCGKCGTCVERLEAIEEAAIRHGKEEGGEVDFTVYEDNDYWKEAVAKAAH